tara:strand:- start:231 stop:470 length:240 start_codon:yes stop_codon:yes gene_type:complete
MKYYYKRLMKQHGGYIPFSVLSQTKSSKRTKKRSRSSKTRSRTIRKSRLPSASRYAVGTILRKGVNLYKLNQLKRWIKI